MTEVSQDSGARVKGTTIVRPVVYGNIARYFGKKREEDGHTHQWTVYIKSFKNEEHYQRVKQFGSRSGHTFCQSRSGSKLFVIVIGGQQQSPLARKELIMLKGDMSTYVKKVNFKLHESYPNQNRVVTKPPYEVTETGWGEFEIIIKIYFNDPQERPVTIYHLLKLFQTETDIMLGKKSLVVEFYDELVFNEPTLMMQHLLNNTKSLSLGAYKHDTDFEEKKGKTLNKIVTAKNKIRYEISELNERLKQKKQTIQKLKDDISKLETARIAVADIESLT